MPDKKQYIISLPGFEEPGRWDVQTYEKAKHDLFKKYPDAQVFEFDAYNDKEEPEEYDMFHVQIDGLDGEGMWDAKTFAENKDNLFKKYPNAKVYRSRGVDYWYNTALEDEEALKTTKPQLDELTASLSREQLRGVSTLQTPAEPDDLQLKYDTMKSEYDALQARYDANPRVVEAKEKYEAEYEEMKRTNKDIEDIRSKINTWHMRDVEAGNAFTSSSSKESLGENMALHAQKMSAMHNPAVRSTVKANAKRNETTLDYQAAEGLLDYAENLRGNYRSVAQGFGQVAQEMLSGYVSHAETSSEKILGKLEKEFGNVDSLTPEQIDSFLAPNEKAILIAYEKYLEASTDKEKKASNAYEGGANFARTIPFIIEFALTKQTGASAARAVTKKIAPALAKWITKQGGKRIYKLTVAKATRGVVGDLTQGAVMTSLRPSAIINVSSAYKDGGLGEAVRVAEDEYIETLSELSGEGFLKALGWAGGAMKSTKWGGKMASKVSNSAFGKAAGWLSNKKFWQSFNNLGYQSFPIEVLEEIEGAALREVTGVDQKALDHLFDSDNFVSMLISFAPMSLLHMGGSMASQIVASSNLSTAEKKLRNILSQSYKGEQVDLIVNAAMAANTPNEVSKALQPIISGMERSGTTYDEIRSVIDYGKAIATYKTMYKINEERERSLIDAKRSELEQNLGTFYQTKNEGTQWQENVVTQATLYDGRTVFLTSAKNEVGEFAAVDAETGAIMPVSESDIAVIENTNTGESSLAVESQSLDDYLTSLVMSERKAAEKARMADEENTQIAALQERLKADPKLNIGTSDAPVIAVFQSGNAQGAEFVLEDGTTKVLTWNEVGDYLGQPIRVLSDAEIAEAEAAALEAEEAKRRAENAQTNEDMDKVDELVDDVKTTEDVVAPTNIPMNPDGTVNTDLFWDQNPEEWVKWNDQQKQDGGVDSMAQVAAGLQTAEAKLDEASKMPLGTPTQREARDQEMGFWQDKINRYNAILEQYQMAEEIEESEDYAVADAQQELAQQPSAAQQILRDLYSDESLSEEEIESYINANVEGSQKDLDKHLAKAPKMGRDMAKYKQEKAAFDAKTAELEAERDLWREVAAYVSAPQVEMDMEPQNALELAAYELSLKDGGIKILPESFRRHTGYGKGEQVGFLSILRTKQKGGISMEAAGERLMEIDRENATGFFDQSDPNAGLNTLLELLSSVKSSSEIRNYILGAREELAQQQTEAVKGAIIEQITQEQEDARSILEESEVEGDLPMTPQEASAVLDAMLMSGAKRTDGAVVDAMQDFADAIAVGVPAKVVTRKNVIQTLKDAGVSERKIAEVKEALRRIQYIVNGFEANGVAYVLADDVITSDDIRGTYVHERQHIMTAQSGLDADLMTMTSREELQDAISKLTNSTFYNGKGHMVLADELISMAMERAYKGENLDEVFERIGLKNENAINFIKSYDNAQRNDSGLSLARVAEIGGNTAEGGSGQDGRAEVSGSTEVGEQGTRPAGRGGEATGDNSSRRGVGFSVTQSIERINNQFNAELQQQIDGTLPVGHVYQLGMPSRILRSTGIADAPIQLNSTRLEDKAKNFGHDFDLSEIKDLVNALQSPMGIFAYGDKSKAQNIVVEIQHNGQNFIVGLAIKPTVNGRVLDVNSIRNVFPKDNAEWLNWISQNKALYLDKEKIQGLIDQQRTNLADVEYLDLDSIAKIVENFENPSSEDIRFSVAFNSANEELNNTGLSMDNPALMQEYDLSAIELSKKGNYVTLSKIVTAEPGQGNGTRFMDDLTKNADANVWTLALTPDTTYGATSVSRLKKFYKRFGFKENKGRNADFNTRESLVRVPKRNIRFSAVRIDPNANQQAEGNVMFSTRRGSLVGIHNISEDKLRKVIKQGGSANPSAAVIDIERQSFDSYGEISFIMPSSLVDAGTGRNAGTFTADAWTPTYPQVQRRFSDDKLQRKYWRDISAIPEEMSHEVRMAFDSWLDNRNASGLAYMFLHERGEAPEMVRVEAEFPQEIKDKVSAILGEGRTGLYDLSAEEKQAMLELYIQENFGGNREEFDKSIADRIQRIEDRLSTGKVPSFVEKRITIDLQWMKGHGYDYDELSKFVSAITADIRHAGEVNDAATTNRALDYIKDNGLEKEFDRWKESLNDRYGIKEYLFDGYTPSGNQRWLPNTVENASRLMNKQGLAGATGMAASFNRFVATLAPKKKTLSDIRASKDLLVEDEKLVDDFREKWSEVFFDLGVKCQPDAKGYEDYGLERLTEAAQKKNPGAYLKKEYGVELSQEDLQKLDEMIKAIKTEFPARYFEIKFQRPVYLNEFAAAVMPTTASEDVKQAVSEAGLPIFEYDSAVEGSRHEATLKATDMDSIRFSIANENQAIFVSNAARAVEGIKMEKATPEQWLKMIEKNGGLKAGEDKWMGLSDWLKESDKKTLTKAEVLDFVNENMIVIKEQHYTEDALSLDALWSEYEDTYEGMDAINYQMEIAAEEYARENSNSEDEYDELYEIYIEDDLYGTNRNKAIAKAREEWEKGITPARLIYGTRINYTTGGLDNLHEIALTVPTIEPWNESDDIHFGDAGEGRAVAWIRFGETEVTVQDATQQRLNEIYDRLDELEMKVSSTGITMEEYEERARLREERDKLQENEPKTQKVLVIDEIQSKRHQEGRERGYKVSREKADAEMDKFMKRMHDKYNFSSSTPFAEVFNEEEMRELARLNMQQHRATFGTTSVPDAPFDKNWHELAMKRMLRYAAENGYDVIAWTKGEQQAERYDIGGVVSAITMAEEHDGFIDFLFDVRGQEESSVIGVEKETGIVHLAEEPLSMAEGKPLSELVGKERAEKMMQMKEDEVLDGQNLQIGGEGMRGFYDKMLPAFMNKYGKKWGVKVEDINLSHLEDGLTMHSVPVTEEMKASVMEGQVMFSVASEEYSEEDTRFSVVTDPMLVAQFESEPKIKVYRAMQLIDGKLYPPMSAKIDGKMREPIELGMWEQAEERPDLVDEKGNFKLDKGNKTSLKARYNPYFHTSTTPLNDQFSSAQSRPELVTVEVEVPASELTSGYKAEGAKDAVGKIEWKAGIVQGKLSGTREVILSRWDKPIRIVPDSEVAAEIVKMFDGKDIIMPSNVVTPSLRAELEKLGVPFVDTNNNGKPVRFSVSERPVDEIVYDGVQKVSEEGKKAKASLKQRMDDIDSKLYYVMRMVAAAQKNYDKKTVDIMTNLAKDLMRDGALSDPTRGEINRLLAAIKNATGKADLTKSATALLDVMVSNQLRHSKDMFKQMLSIKTTKVNTSGVEVQGRLDLVGQRLLSTIKGAIGLTPEQIEDRIAEAKEKLDEDSDVVVKNAQIDLAALNLAKQYVEGVVASQAEEKDLRHELETAEESKKNGKMTAEGLREFRKATEDAIRQNRLERTTSYRSLLSEMARMIAESFTRAGNFRDAEKERVERIHHFANSDMQGMDDSEHVNNDKAFVNNPLLRFFLKSLATFDQMLRQFGRKHANGEGYLWSHFMRGWLESTEKEYLGVTEAHNALDAKAKEVFGVKLWSDIFSKIRTLPTMTVEFWDGGKMKEHVLTQGNLLYIYMVNKMSDGKMKLRRMGITEEDVQRMSLFMDPRLIELGEWLQNDFLPSLRDKYNAVHEKMFGAPMAAIDNYFPIRVLANARTRDVDVATPEGSSNPSTITGSIIKRTKNSLALDVLGSDALDVVLEHIQQMEHWAAFAEWNRDLNTLLSYKKFRNRVQNMSGLYGSGAVAWKNFRDAAEIAAGVYRPASVNDSIDKTAVNIAKGVTAAKISFRVFTAIKQLLSMPAFVSDANMVELSKAIGTPWKAWNWAMTELPIFQKRWLSRQAGDSRLMATESDWKLWKNNIVEAASRYGMAPNAFVDALTVSIGAKAIYETKKAQYLENGYSEEQAEKRAKQDATILFNESQQSNEGAFLSAMQMDRTFTSVALTVFRNSSMGYQRMLVDALRNIKHRMTKGYKEESIEFMTKQMIRDGLSEENARRAAERIYKKELTHSAARVATFGFLVQFAWNLGAYLPYLILGNDDDEKRKMMKDAAVHGLVGGWNEGLSGGSIMSEMLNMLAKGESLKDYDPSLMPVMSDMKRLVQLWSTDYVAAANETFNLLVQAGIGVNPQTLTDMVVAITDACDGDPETSREVVLLLMRMLQVPQSQIDQIYIDEIDFTVDKGLDLTIEEFARRYAEYKKKRTAPLTHGLYSDEQGRKVEDKYIKRFVKRAEELKRTRGSETAKAWYDYVDNEYKEISTTINDLQRQAKKAAMRGDTLSAYEFAEELDKLLSTPEVLEYQNRAGIVQGEERIRKAMKDMPQSREEFEDLALQLRRQLVEEMQSEE